MEAKIYVTGKRVIASLPRPHSKADRSPLLPDSAVMAADAGGAAPSQDEFCSHAVDAPKIAQVYRKSRNLLSHAPNYYLATVLHTDHNLSFVTAALPASCRRVRVDLETTRTRHITFQNLQKITFGIR
jgi:hypothetical protein